MVRLFLGELAVRGFILLKKHTFWCSLYTRTICTKYKKQHRQTSVASKKRHGTKNSIVIWNHIQQKYIYIHNHLLNFGFFLTNHAKTLGHLFLF